MLLEQLCIKLKLHGALLTTYDGETVESRFNETLAADDAAPLAAVVVRLFDALVRQCQHTFPEMLIMDGQKGSMDKIICIPVKAQEQILFLFAQGDVNVGMIRIVLQDILKSERQDAEAT
jgi:predicted regulator of Ras-like GTPase activity (Roadblock/LC7/MglB family)